jgi:hypothetical protein
LKLINHHCGRRIAAGARNVRDITIRMDGLAVLIGTQIDRQIDWLGANCTGYF